jgi:hypothetical protein
VINTEIPQEHQLTRSKSLASPTAPQASAKPITTVAKSRQRRKAMCPRNSLFFLPTSSIHAY